MKPFRFIVDENLPPHLAFWLRDKGHEATHVAYESLGSSLDTNIWTWAADRDAIVVSKDEDFYNRLVAGKPRRLIWIRWGNVRKRPLIAKLDQLWPNIEEALAEGDWLVELTTVGF